MEITIKRFSNNSVKSGITKTWLTLGGQLQKHLHTYNSLSLGDIEMTKFTKLHRSLPYNGKVCEKALKIEEDWLIQESTRTN